MTPVAFSACFAAEKPAIAMGSNQSIVLIGPATAHLRSTANTRGAVGVDGERTQPVHMAQELDVPAGPLTSTFTASSGINPCFGQISVLISKFQSDHHTILMESANKNLLQCSPNSGVTEKFYRKPLKPPKVQRTLTLP
jgi:hypothetical protein